MRRGSAGMSRPNGAQAGFALVTALLVATLLTIAVSTALTVVLAGSVSAHGDAQQAAARRTAELGLAMVRERLRWDWDLPPQSLGGVVGAASWQALACPLAPPDPRCLSAMRDAGVLVSPALCHVVDVAVTARCGQSTSVVGALVVVAPDGLPRGVTIAGDVQVDGHLALSGPGLYLAGTLYGREHVDLCSGQEQSDPRPPDLAWPGLYAVRGVHAGVAVFAQGAEVHSQSSADPEDDDPHTGGGPPGGLVQALERAHLGALGAHSLPPGAAYDGSNLRLDRLPAAPPARAPVCPGSGLIVFLRPEPGTPLFVTGDRTQLCGACPVTVVVDGDCILGASADDPAGMNGALLVTGALQVTGSVRLCGSLYAGSLDVLGDLDVSSMMSPATGQESAPGMSNPHIAAWRD